MMIHKPINSKLWQSITEDIEALSSPNFRKHIAKARRQKQRISAQKAKKTLELSNR